MPFEKFCLAYDKYTKMGTSVMVNHRKTSIQKKRNICIYKNRRGSIFAATALRLLDYLSAQVKMNSQILSQVWSL